MKLLLLSVLLTLTISARKCKSANRDQLPACVQKRIDEIKAGPVYSPAAVVKEYEYKGKRVYYFSADCCDQYNVVVDDQCNAICAPSGGLTGKGDRKCDDFDAVAKELRVVWKDPRGK